MIKTRSYTHGLTDLCSCFRWFIARNTWSSTVIENVCRVSDAIMQGAIFIMFVCDQNSPKNLVITFVIITWIKPDFITDKFVKIFWVNILRLEPQKFFYWYFQKIQRQLFGEWSALCFKVAWNMIFVILYGCKNDYPHTISTINLLACKLGLSYNRLRGLSP